MSYYNLEAGDDVSIAGSVCDDVIAARLGWPRPYLPLIKQPG